MDREIQRVHRELETVQPNCSLSWVGYPRLLTATSIVTKYNRKTGAPYLSTIVRSRESRSGVAVLYR